MSSSVASRFAPPCAALVLLLLAGSAHAQFGECVPPEDVPGAMVLTIVNQAGFDFGMSSLKTCDSIVKKAVSACKAQVKAADKCFRRLYDTNYTIAVKQCQQLETSEDRADCKAESKLVRNDGKTDSANDEESGLEECDDEFEEAISLACVSGIAG